MVNIHVLFKSGIPFVEDIKAPQIVLPGTFVGVREPHVTPGAYEVTGGGWKLFEKPSDAESHINGIEYTPTSDPLYWYQDGYYLAYYAKTYLGETYSNTVQVSVANYHDLKKVMEDTEHHYYVDNKNVKRNSKIYITDATNGATQLKNFFDLSKSTLDGRGTSSLSCTPTLTTRVLGHLSVKKATASLVTSMVMVTTSTDSITHCSVTSAVMSITLV